MASTRKPRNLNKRFGKFNEEIHDKGGASLNKKTRKRKLTDMLGSQWSKDELDRFYEAYRKHGKDWKQIAGAVRNRSAGMVEALYNMNKAYLSLPEGHATAAGLIAMMTDHYNILEGSDSEHESNDASRSSRKTPKRGRGKFKLMSKASDGPCPDLLQCQGSTSGYGCFSLLKRKRSGDLLAGGKPRVVGKRTPRIPVPYFLKEDRNKIASPSKQCLRAESLPVDDDGVHVAAMALTEASQRGGSPQISRTPSRRRGHVTNSPVPSGDRKDSELKIGESKIRNCQLDDDHLEGSLGSREAENGEFFNNVCISETRQKSKKLRGKGSREVEDDPLDDDKEACSGTEEGTNARRTKDETMSDFADVIALQTSKSSKRRSQQLFFGDESSALDALQTLADLSLNILLPASTIESELSIQVKEEKGAEAMDEKPSLPESLSTNLLKETINSSEWKDKGYSTAVDGAGRKSSKPSRGFAYGLNTSENKQQIGSSNSKIKKRKPKHTIETVSKCPFEVDFQKSEHHIVEVVPEDGKRSTTKVKRVCQIPVPKHGKSSKLQEGHPTASDLERVMTNAPEAAAACSAGNDQILYTKVRNRRKSNLQEALAGVQVKSSESATEEHPERYPFCRRPYDLKEKLSHGLSSCLFRRWCKFEWFYSAIDYPWFAKSEFVEYLNHVRLGHIPRLTRVEWGVIRSSLGKPRRLSYQFLKQEREKLEQYRESVRSHYSELRVGARDGLPTDLSRPLSVGQRVFACHPRSREVHDGSVLTVDRNRCRVQFDRPELGVEFVMDVDCMPVNLLDDLSEPLRREKIGINKFSTGLSNLMLDEQKEIKLRDSMKFSLAESLDVAEETSHADSYNYPMNTLMIQAKGDTLDAILQAKAAVNDVAVAAQHAMYNQPFTLAQIQAREADIRALADLSRALDKKEALIMELRQMNEEVSGIQKSGEHIKDLESFRKQYAMVLLQLRDVNDQVASALLYLRQRNTYERNSSLPFPKSNETPGLLGCLNSSGLLGQDSGSNVVEVIESSKQKAKAMVDVAVQAMCSLKGGEDAFSKIGEALELASNRNPTSNSSIMAVRNGFADQLHDNSACEDHITSKFEPDAAQATSPNFFSTAANEIQFPSELISSCVATLFMIQVCSERQYPPAEVAQILDSAVASLQPCCPQNLPIFREIETCMGIIKNQMLALVPTPTTSIASDTPVV